MRRDARRTAASCSSGERSPWRGRSSEVALARELRAGLARAADIGRAGQEDEHVAVEPVGDERPHRGRDLQSSGRSSGPGGARSRRRSACPRCGAHARRGTRRAARRQRRRHRDEAEVGPSRALEALEERERDVALEVPLVELVEHDRRRPRERRGREELAPEHALGDEADARAALEMSSNRTW